MNVIETKGCPIEVMSALQGETPLDMAVRSKNGYIVKSMKKEQHDRGVATQSGFINRLSSSKVGSYWNYTLWGRFLFLRSRVRINVFSSNQCSN